uniref:Uncharacterized protein n=1 Tax=Meloidogyne javanica TaxID=6303 RepID=A0A915N4M8_MELJA
MANEIFGGRKDKIAREYQFSTGHSSKTSFDRAMDKALEGTKDLVKGIPKVAKKKAVSFAQGFGKAVQQVAVDQLKSNKEFKGSIYYSITELFLNGSMKVEESDETFQMIVGAINEYHGNEESLYRQVNIPIN